MNDNGYLPANPQPIAITAQGDVFSTDNAFAGMSGLTKREHFAAFAMQGMLANSSYCVLKRFKLSEIADDAIVAADELLEGLEQTPS